MYAIRLYTSLDYRDFCYRLLQDYVDPQPRNSVCFETNTRNSRYHAPVPNVLLLAIVDSRMFKKSVSLNNMQ